MIKNQFQAHESQLICIKENRMGLEGRWKITPKPDFPSNFQNKK